ncbi:hypothetical protein HAX54_026330 [Datura stramonium]|uniref:SMAX1-like nucleotide binding domain-containing protein n=1 Tax=Datura stramonium TaxID=4076 RepID=A0ABS8RKA2_DATST|nr:hypothetical protein [Datura stramonium]
MREAGFSSIQVKTNVENTISSENNTKPMVIASGNNLKLSLCKSGDDPSVKRVMMEEAMINKKRRNTVIIGECLANAEGVASGVIDKFDEGEVSFDIKHVQFITVPLFTLRNVSKHEFVAKIGVLRILLRSYINRGVVLYLGDLKWISKYWSKHNEPKNNYMIMELSRLLCGEMRENGRLWLMGIASFETYEM